MGRNQLLKYTSRLMACLLAVALIFGTAVPVRAEGESGTCGQGLTWTFSAGTLTISGTGAMEDYLESTMAPWYPLRREILRVELPEGLTSVGDLAFYGCENLTAATIPNSVARIGSYAFAQCTGMSMLSLGSGVAQIGECAFSDCVSLASLRLPNGLRSIGNKAFYRCESIPTVTVPASVVSIGMSAFGYCKSLVSAQVLAQIDTIPEWMFYGCGRLVSVTLPEKAEHISEFAFRGCDQLATVYYDGSSRTPEEIQQIINSDVPGFDGTGYVTGDPAPDSAASGTTHENPDGTTTQENITVTQGKDATVSTTVETTRDETGTGTSTKVEIQVTIENEQGWDEAADAVTDALKDYNDGAAQTGTDPGKMQVDVFVKDGQVDPEFVDIAAGRDVTMTIMTQDGSKWRIDGTTLTNVGSCDLRYTIVAGSEELRAELGVENCYVLRFLAPAEINAEVLISLGAALAQRNATLLQRDAELKRIQSVVVDRQGFAHFYLASVSDQTEYYIAIDLPDARQEAIIPDELLDSYGNPVRHTPIQYEITGRTSSWGMSFGQVTGILVAVLAGCVIVVGFVMYTMNKRKLKQGYVPDLDEEDLE